jgi:hypothetical protein
MSFPEAHELRTTLGKLYQKAKGPEQVRARQLFGTLDDAMRKALPDATARHEWKRLGQLYRGELARYRNGFVRKALDDSPTGAATADAYVTRALTGTWTPQKAVEIRALVKAAGPNSAAHEVLKDAVLRQALAKATRVGEGGTATVDWGLFARHLRNPDGLAPMFQTVLRSPLERRQLLSFADEAARAQAAARGVQGASVFDAFTMTEAAVAATTAVLGHPEGVLASVASHATRAAFRWLRTGENRAALRAAATTVADSTTGRRLLQGLAVAAAQDERR